MNIDFRQAFDPVPHVIFSRCRKKRDIPPSTCKSGILRDKTINNKLMYIPNEETQITPSAQLNYSLDILDYTIYEPTNFIQYKYPRFLTNDIKLWVPF